jgi:hypothetical protein
MSLDRPFAICPYLKGSSGGVICAVTGELARNIPDINPDICISRHFEVCHLYLLKLHDIDIDSCLTNSGSPKGN